MAKYLPILRNTWGKNSIATANHYEIVNGYGDTRFGPNDPITREQMAVMIVKAAKLSKPISNKTFADGQNISDWAKSSVALAVGNCFCQPKSPP